MWGKFGGGVIPLRPYSSQIKDRKPLDVTLKELELDSYQPSVLFFSVEIPYHVSFELFLLQEASPRGLVLTIYASS